MKHASDSVLQTLRSAGHVSRRDYRHVDGCIRCRTALAAPLPPQPGRSHGPAIFATVCAVVLAASLFAIAPLRAAAFGFVEIFEPHQIAFVPMTADDLRGANAFPDFNDLGTATELRASQTIEESSEHAAQAAAGFRLRVPANAGTYRDVAYTVTSPSLEQFAFDGRKAHDLPVGFDGSVVRLAIGPSVIARYGLGGFGRCTSNAHHACGFTIVGGRTTRRSEPPRIVVAQMVVPKLGSTGVSMRDIERYMLSRPGVNPKLAAAFAALRDPTTTMLLPIPVDRRYAHPVFVDGVWGTGIGDETGLGAGVVWERSGFVYAVGGTASSRDVLAIANSLK